MTCGAAASGDVTGGGAASGDVTCGGEASGDVTCGGEASGDVTGGMVVCHGLRPKWEGAPFDYRADAAFEGVAAI